MSAYIEVVIMDNLILTSSIAVLSYVTCGQLVRKRRTLVASLLGTAISVTYPFWRLQTALLVIAKIAVGLILSAILFCGLEKPILSTLIFFANTALCGGVCIMLNYFITQDWAKTLALAPTLPYCIPSAIGVTLALCVKRVHGAVQKRRRKSAYTYGVSVTINGKSVAMTGYLDSGNFLFHGNSPIVVIKLTALTRFFERNTIVERIIGIKTINGVGASSKLFLLKPERFILYSDKKKNKHNIDLTLGVSEADFDCSADMLLPPSLIGG